MRELGKAFVAILTIIVFFIIASFLLSLVTGLLWTLFKFALLFGIAWWLVHQISGVRRPYRY